MATKHFFLWVSHGENISGLNRMVDKYHSKLGRFVYYSVYKQILQYPFLEYIYLDKLPKTPLPVNAPAPPPTHWDVSTIAKLYDGVRAVNNPNQLQGFDVPPILYTAEHDTTKVEFNFMGLYYFEINSIGTIITRYKKIFDGYDLINLYGRNNITISKIEKHVLDECNKLNITDLQTVSLGLYACEEVTPNYIHGYTGTLPVDINYDLSSVPKANILASSYIQQPRISHFSLLRILVKNELIEHRMTNAWNTLAGLMNQGCGLNVLSFYGVISEPRARERAVCLTLKGTSIFSIVNYIDHFNQRASNYAVVRLDLLSGVNTIYTFITQYTSPQSYAIVFKIYDDNFIKNTTKYSEFGHTISVCFIFNTNAFWFSDPQANIYTELNLQDPTQLHNIITTNYPGKKFIDLIMEGDYQNSFTNQPVFTFNEMVDSIQKRMLTIRDVPKDMYYGGKKSAVKTKKYTRSRRSKKYKKSNK